MRQTTDYALVLQNRSSVLINEINNMGYDGYGQAHRLGSREMDRISRFAGIIADEKYDYVRRHLALIGIDLDAQMEAAERAYVQAYLSEKSKEKNIP